MSPTQCVDDYNKILSEILDDHVPEVTISIVQRNTPWYTQDVRHAKTVCRKLERHWLQSKLEIDYTLFKTQRNLLHRMRIRAKRQYFLERLQNSQSSKVTFSVLNNLLHKSHDHPLPDHTDVLDLANEFADYFEDKIERIRQNFTTNPQQCDFAINPNLTPLITQFNLATQDEIVKMVSKSKTKSCALDPIPTWLVKKCPSTIPALTSIVNSSMSTGTVPPSLKQALVIPVLKKAGLDVNQMKNYRPVSNLAFSSKLLERIVSSRLSAHCDELGFVSKYQSAYKKQHSCETALVKVQNDLLRAVDSQGGAILVLLDLSAAFDTIDHNVMLDVLHTDLKMSGTALNWFSSYLDNRKQTIRVGKAVSSEHDLPYGVPQGSVLGPQLFTLYTTRLVRIIVTHNMIYHLYADDTQLYITFSPRSQTSIQDTQRLIHQCTSDIQEWMRTNFLKLNSDKTEVLVITTPLLARAHSIFSVNICDTMITVSNVVRDLGVLYDSTLNMDTHVKALCKKAYFQLHLIHKVRPFITQECAKLLVHANVMSVLDYCNGLLFGLPKILINRLQRVQDCAARVITQTNSREHITPIRKGLHWLPIKHRIDYKILMLTFKAMNGLAPSYMKDMLSPYVAGRALRSQNQYLLTPVTSRLITYGYRSFQHAAPSLWNDLPLSIRKIDDLATFKCTLKTHMFKEAYDC